MGATTDLLLDQIRDPLRLALVTLLVVLVLGGRRHLGRWAALGLGAAAVAVGLALLRAEPVGGAPLLTELAATLLLLAVVLAIRQVVLRLLP
ncbi:hypothetical protein [Rubellimicrobium sp. CFH 75288]|uniref:hypothetical protein n=1 Tax=Rubellimicrobium sp. CFH 75288 TaxID=2697034 RepID=UPI001412FC5C|nr:hypothetical protein [Rubellimicrobium sp. CFH 75288]NAZ36178.1 hypothetical protein [Rubellimicrobium sp. CFH 75288]